MNSIQELNNYLGNIDLYLLDFILKGTFENTRVVLDAGCGEGRNLSYFSNNAYDIYGMDREPLAIKMCQMRFQSYPKDHFIVGDLGKMMWDDGIFDLVISSAVLHFAESHTRFFDMWAEHTRVTKQGGLLFLRMASRWGIENPGTEFNFYLDDQLLQEMLASGWVLVSPVKSVLVENKRSMSAILLERR